MRFERAQRVGSEPADAAPLLACVAIEEGLRQEDCVAGPFAQRRDLYRDFG